MVLLLFKYLDGLARIITQSVNYLVLTSRQDMPLPSVARFLCYLNCCILSRFALLPFNQISVGPAKKLVKAVYRKFGLKPRPFRTALSYNGKSDNQAKN
jgi:hypothetical protein